ncbi:MAG: class I SAM-dependent methyltransferase [Bacteroidetes bacterium]|nr:class I SAM-dependent methyltransferase [Bacteroidota bacterium]
MKIFWLLNSYIRYYFKSKSRYVIHSPFTYQLIQNIFDNKTVHPELKNLDKAKKQLFKRTAAIETTDLGAGAGNKQYATYIDKLGKIARRRSPGTKSLHILFNLSRHFHPNYILEFGTSAGISASYIGKANHFKKFVSMEGCAVLAAHAREYFTELKLSGIEVKVGDFDVILDKTLDEFEQLDLVFVDGNHRKRQTLDYFRRCLKKTHENSIIVFDDIHWSAEMEEAWMIIKENEKISVTVDLFNMGIVFFRSGINKQDFIIRF